MRALLFASALAAFAAADDAVVVLTPDNFEEEVGDKNTDLVLVKFYAPWCGHCKSMAGDFIKAAEQLKESHPKIKLADFDADAHKDYAGKYEVQGFPTLKVFRNGDLKSPDDYNGPRNADGIVKAVLKLSRPAILEVSSQDELDKAIEQAGAEGDVAVYGTFKEAGKDLDAFKKFSKKGSKHYTVILYTGAAERKIAIQPPNDEAVEYTDAKISSAKLSAWAEKNKFPPYGEISQDNFKNYMDRELPIGWTFVDPEDEETTKQVSSMMTKLGKKYKGKVSLVWLSGPQFGQMAERVGLEGQKFPGFGLDDSAAKKHFAFKPEGELFDEAKLDEFISGVLAGTVDATVRSEPEPEEQPGEDGVFVLTGNNFAASTVDSGMDVMVEFYAPWCGHCKSLAPEYSAAAKALAGSDKVRVAKMDATANDIPSAEFDVKGYPTLYFIKASAEGGPGKVMPYNGDRSKDGVLKFIEEHATHPVNVE